MGCGSVVKWSEWQLSLRIIDQKEQLGQKKQPQMSHQLAHQRQEKWLASFPHLGLILDNSIGLQMPQCDPLSPGKHSQTGFCPWNQAANNTGALRTIQFINLHRFSLLVWSPENRLNLASTVPLKLNQNSVALVLA